MKTYKLSIWPIPGTDTDDPCNWTGYFTDAENPSQAVSIFHAKFPSFTHTTPKIWDNATLEEIKL